MVVTMSEQLAFDFSPPRLVESSLTRAVYTDYDSWVAHFAERPKTTDDCYTPQDVYEVILEWLAPKLRGKRVLRPFFPGGDYQRETYPADGVVVDNPPFSLLSQIVGFFLARGIPFFLFASGLTSIRQALRATVIYTGRVIRYENGAQVPTCYVSSLFGDLGLMLAPELGARIRACASQAGKPSQQQYRWPAVSVGSAELQYLAQYGGHFELERSKLASMAGQPGITIFGGRLLIPTAEGRRLEDERRRLEDERRLVVELSERNQAAVDRLDRLTTP